MFVNSDNYIKYLKIWLITLFLLIVAMVVVGGLTRLTDSGLSITAWELFSGVFPPLNKNEWIELKNEFENFHFHAALSREEKIEELNFNFTTVHNGYVHDVYENILKSNGLKKTYLCGWNIMLDEAKSNLLELGLKENQIILESYG